MVKVHIERGRIIDTQPEVVLCLWENWDVFDAVLGNKYNLQKIRDGAFKVKLAGVAGKVEHVSSEVHRSSGVVKYLITGYKWGSQLQTVCTLRYSSTRDNKTSVEGILDCEAKGILGFGLKIFEKTLYKIADMIISDGDEACTFISKNPEEARMRLSIEQIKTLDRYLLKSVQQLAEEEKKEIIPQKELTWKIYPQPLKANITIKADRSEKLFTLMMEGPESFPFKLFNDVKIDKKTLNEVMKEIELTATLANYWHFSRRGMKPPSVSVSLSQKDLRIQLKKLGFFIFNYIVPKNIAESLSKEEKITHLLVEIDPRVLDIPWELMYDGNDFLCLRYAVGRKILTTEIPKITPRKLRKKIRFLLIGDPSEELPESKKEVEIIKSELEKLPVDITILTGSEITKRDFLLALSNGTYDIIHYAGHAYFDVSTPDESYLKFSGDVCNKYEIERFLRDNPPAIVFVNACSSAREKATPSIKFEREIAGLARAFVFSGSMGYIGALWPIYDDEAASFAANFYQQVLKGFTLGESLRQARKLIYEKSGDKTLSWASFILYGDPTLELPTYS